MPSTADEEIIEFEKSPGLENNRIELSFLSRNRFKLFVLKIKSVASVIPKKLIVVSVPLLPSIFQKRFQETNSSHELPL